MINIKNIYFLILLFILLVLFISPQYFFAEYSNSYYSTLGSCSGSLLLIILLSFIITKSSGLHNTRLCQFIFSKIGLISIFIIIQIYACMHTIHARNEDKNLSKKIVSVILNVTSEYSSQIKWINNQTYLFSKKMRSTITPELFLSLDGLKNIRLTFNEYKDFLKQKNAIVTNYKSNLLKELQIALKKRNGATVTFWKAYLASSQQSEKELGALENVQMQEANTYIALANLFEKSHGNVIFKDNNYQFGSIDEKNNFNTLINQIRNLSKQESQLNHDIAEKIGYLQNYPARQNNSLK